MSILISFSLRLILRRICNRPILRERRTAKRKAARRDEAGRRRRRQDADGERRMAAGDDAHSVQGNSVTTNREEMSATTNGSALSRLGGFEWRCTPMLASLPRLAGQMLLPHTCASPQQWCGRQVEVVTVANERRTKQAGAFSACCFSALLVITSPSAHLAISSTHDQNRCVGVARCSQLEWLGGKGEAKRSRTAQWAENHSRPPCSLRSRCCRCNIQPAAHSSHLIDV